MKKKTSFKTIFNISFVFVVTFLSIFLTLRGDGFLDKIAILGRMDIPVLLIMLGLIVLFVLIQCLIYFCFARLFTRNYKYKDAIVTESVGTFYASFTPGSSGSQIMQAHTYKKQGLHISSAVGALAMYTIVYTSVIIIFGLLSLIFKFEFISSLGSVETNLVINNHTLYLPIWPLTIFAFIFNVFFILMVLLFSYWHKFHNFIMGPVLGLLAKLKIVKNVNKKREDLKVQVENFKMELKRLLSNIPFTILVGLLMFIFLTIKYSIPFWCGVAIGDVECNISNFFDSVFLCNYHQMITTLIPIPGGAGISEFFFSQLFYNASGTGFYSSINFTSAALLLWRTMTFILPLVVAAIISLTSKIPENQGLVNNDSISNRETLIALERETLLERRIMLQKGNIEDKILKEDINNQIIKEKQNE